MKKLFLFATLLLCGVALVACCGQADTITTTEGLVLAPNADGTAYTITDYIGAATEVTIPSTHGGLPITAIGVGAFDGTDVTAVTIGEAVTEIGVRAFAKCESLTAITLPDSVTTLGRSAFSGCTALADVTLSASLEKLPDNAFRDCTALNAIVIPDSVTELGEFAFAYCESLTSIHIGRGVKQIGADAFYKCEGLAAVHITDLAAWCRIQFDANPLTEAGALFLGDTLVTELVIPFSIGCINDYAFAGCRSLTSITLHDDLYNLGSHAFEGCTNLVSAAVPGDLLGHLDSKRLQTLTVLDGIVPEDAFRACTGLQTLVLADKVTEVEDGAFWGCRSLTSVTIGEQVSYIGDFAFEGCVRLCEVINRSALTLVAGDFTDGGIARYAIEVHNSASKRVTEGDFVYYNGTDGKHLVAYLGFESELTLPEGAPYRIHGHAFANCQSLTRVTIGDNVTEIGESAFSGCSYLTEVTIGSGVTLIRLNAFGSCDLAAVTFAATDGWYIVYIVSAEEGDPVDVTDPQVNAEHLRDTYREAFWKRTFL